MGRRRKKSPDGASLVAGIVVLIAIAIFVSTSAPGTEPVSEFVGKIWSFLFLVVFLFLLVAFFIWFFRGLNKIAKQPKFGKNGETVAADDRISTASSGQTGNDQFAEPPDQWSLELIASLDWRVFEKLCMRLWQFKGFAIEETSRGADGGVDFYLYSQATKTRIGVVQCKSWRKQQINVKVVRELQGVTVSENLSLGLLMYHGSLSKAASEFLANPDVSIKAQGSAEILHQIQTLPDHEQAALLEEITRGDYKTPSCPNCDVKLIERKAKKTGNMFLGCPNFPRCRYTRPV